jgi:hypothetical protein
MNNHKKVGEILETNDLTIFKEHPMNRDIRPNHIKNLIRSMKTKGWVKSSTVKVNKKFQIIDGHHRLVAAKSLGNISIRYEVINDADQNDIIEMNIGGVRWSPFDHIERYVKQGNKHYKHLHDFTKKYPMFNITEASMFCRNNFSGVDRETFEQGRFEVADMEKAHKWADQILQLKPYFKYYNRSIFVRAMMKIFSRKPEFEFKQFLRKVELRPSSIHLCGTVDSYIDMIEEIYNYRNAKKVNLRF